MRENQIDERPRKTDLTADESVVPSEWAVGDVILDTYEVTRIHEGGGMGLVYRVHHRRWNMDLAVKSPRPDYFRTESQKQLFVSECETWSALGLHPHIVNCFYVRTLGGIPRVFAEYVEGGSLHDWIKSRRLYKGSLRENLKTILDIAIQMAWGLDYAHEQGLIHQDVKPGNVLMTPDGSAKISDFGLAKARGAISEPGRDRPTRSIVASTGGMTPAYCSPEQIRGETLTRRTDIWSWAVSVLEMIVGGVFWQAGPLAAEVLADLDQHVPAEHLRCFVPAKLKELLGKCLRTEQVHRPHDFAAIVDALLELFQTEFRVPFQRTLPDKLDLDADTLNNRVVSCVDLGKIFTKGAQNAFSLLFDLRRKRSDHIQGRLNDALIYWRKVGLSVKDLNREMDNAMRLPLYTPGFLKWQIKLELEKSDTRRAMRILAESSHSGDKQSLLAQVEQRHEDLHRKFIAFFSEDKRHGRPLAYQELAASDDRLRSSLHAITGDQTGIAAVAQNDGASIRLLDIKNNRQIATLDPPHHFSKIAFSELGSFLAIADASVDANNLSERETLYSFSVCRPFSFGGWTTFSERIYEGVRLKAVTIDDQCLCATLWLECRNRVFELIHVLRDGNLQPFRCDFRKPSHVGAFDRIFLSGDRTLLLAVNGSRCSLWRYPSATCDDGMNALDIDLADFGLIDTTGHLPGFALEYGFEYRIDDWNAHRLMRLLSESCSKTHAEYHLCRPADTSHLFGVRSTKEELLRLADDAEKVNDRSGALCHLNRYCAILTSYEESVMSRRHALAQQLADSHVERVWHHESHNWYWEGNVFGLVPAGTDRVALQILSGLEMLTLPHMRGTGGALRWRDADRNEEFSVGIDACEGGRVLALVHTRTNFRNSIALCTPKEDCPATSEWSVHLGDDNWPDRSVLRKVARLGETVYAEIQPGVVAALDLNSGLVRNQVRLAEGVLFLKALRTPEGEDFLFVANQSAGCMLLDTSLSPCEDWWGRSNEVQHLRPVEAVADDLSAIVGWLSPYRLVHIQRNNLAITDVWNFWDQKYSVVRHKLEYLYDVKLEYLYDVRGLVIALSPCGKTVSYVLWDYVVVIDVATKNVVLQWHRPWDKVNALAFDGSGRWLMFAHEENQLEVFHLLWNVKDAPLVSAYQAN